jgi:hypothetical protein
MQKVKAAWGLKISLACAGSGVPPAFLAALIANESGIYPAGVGGGDPTAKRYEPTVCGHLAAVVSGAQAAYDPPGARRPIGRGDLQLYIGAAGGPGGAELAPIHKLADLAASYGLTQVMGFHVLMWGDPALADLSKALGTADAQLKFTIQLLDSCAEQNALDLSMPDVVTIREFFTWWNTGRVNGATYDPNYAANGVDRMKAYDQLSAADSAPAGPVQ